jgi:fatty-acyl-CoA synthase
MLSYSRGPALALLEETIDEVFVDTVQRLPQNEALVSVHQNVRLTFTELHREVEKTARGLAGLGFQKGDRVGIWSTNCVEWILLQLACARLGLILVNVNPAYGSHELGFVLRKSRMRGLFINANQARVDCRGVLHEAVAGQSLSLQHIIYIGEDSWRRMAVNGTELPSVPLSSRDAVTIQYTSGTTGSPKGVLLSHRNVLNNGLLVGRQMKLTERDRICVPVPMYHCFGCVMGTMAAITSGATMILPAPHFDPLATLRSAAVERATVTYGVPTMFIAQLQHPEFPGFDFSSLRTGIMAGAPCPIEVMRRLVDQMHCHGMIIAYGQTESSPVITMSSLDDPLEVRVSTVGRALPQTEVRIVSPSSGETVPIGEQGELCTRGYLVMCGYDEEPDATSKAIDSEGWLHTGDLGIMQPDGYFRITGRAKDMIIRGGENIYPREIEEFLYAHPKIAEVQVVGLPDVNLGEIVCAWIHLKNAETATEEEIRRFCYGKIAHFKIPQHIRFVDSFPTTVTGKVQKYKIREFEIRERGLERTGAIETA